MALTNEELREMTLLAFAGFSGNANPTGNNSQINPGSMDAASREIPAADDTERIVPNLHHGLF